MDTLIIGIIAAVSTTAFIALWFLVVSKDLRAKKNMVQSAQVQLESCLKKNANNKECREKRAAQFILARSEDIYKQAVDIYNQALKKPQNRIPAFFMGFHSIS